MYKKIQNINHIKYIKNIKFLKNILKNNFKNFGGP